MHLGVICLGVAYTLLVLFCGYKWGNKIEADARGKIKWLEDEVERLRSRAGAVVSGASNPYRKT